MSKTSNMTFKRYGRSYHLNIRTAEDLEHVRRLDEAHWVATNAPIGTINCDDTFLRFLDTNNNGRITCREIKDAIRWLLGILRDRQGITGCSKTLHLSAIDTDADEGGQIYDGVRNMLARLGQGEGQEITLDQVRQIKVQAEAAPVSEAGIVLATAAEDQEIRQFITDIIATTGAVAHPGGGEGIGTTQLEQFIDTAASYLQWYEQGVIAKGKSKSEIMPLGADTTAAYEILTSVRGKIDQYFAQCQALAIDERFMQRMGWTESELEGLDFDDPNVLEEVLRKAPLAKAKSDQMLGFEDKINPYYAKSLNEFRQQVMEPVLGRDGKTLSATQWHQIKSFFKAHQDWIEAKRGGLVETLGVEKLRGYLDERYASAVRTVIAESSKTALILDNIRLIEKVILYQAHMIELVNNFVSFPHLYDTDSRAMFEMGSLVMDGRRFNLAVRAENRAQHAEVAKTSNMYVLYVQLGPDTGGSSVEAAVPVTSGGKGNLCVGKRGVFYDIDGKEYDARIVDMIENPISFREALVSPFQRIGRLLVGKIESITTAAEKKLDSKVSATLDQVATQPATPVPAQGQQSGVSRAGLLMGAGVTLAALGSALAYITSTLANISPLKIAIVVLGAVLAVMLPISIVAILKLRRRDMSAILEGSGWGINARMRLTRKQCRFFTEKPRYPKGTKGVGRFG